MQVDDEANCSDVEEPIRATISNNSLLRNFNHHKHYEMLNLDESPYIKLTDNPKYIDILCVNCYECIKYADADRHSRTCG